MVLNPLIPIRLRSTRQTTPFPSLSLIESSPPSIATTFSCIRMEARRKTNPAFHQAIGGHGGPVLPSVQCLAIPFRVWFSGSREMLPRCVYRDQIYDLIDQDLSRSSKLIRRKRTHRQMDETVQINSKCFPSKVHIYVKRMRGAGGTNEHGSSSLVCQVLPC
jgi:hypothetical protein